MYISRIIGKAGERGCKSWIRITRAKNYQKGMSKNLNLILNLSSPYKCSGAYVDNSNIFSQFFRQKDCLPMAPARLQAAKEVDD